MKQLIGGIAGALITGVAILGWNGPTARSEASWPDSTSRGPVQLVSEQGVTPAAVMESEARAARAERHVRAGPARRGAPGSLGRRHDDGSRMRGRD